MDTPVSAPVASSNASAPIESNSAPATNTQPQTDSQQSAQTDRNEKGQFVAKNGQPNQQNPAQQTPAQKAEAIRKLKLKIDGHEEEYAEEDVVKLAQMGRASQKRFQEVAEKRKQAEDFIKMLKENPISVLTNPAIGVDMRKLAEEFLHNEYKKEVLTPEARKIQELEDQLRKHDEDKKKIEETKRQEEFNKLQDHYKQEFDKKITTALQSSGLPKSPKTVKRMADYMIMALENGIDLEPGNVVELVRQDYMTEVSELFSQTDGDTLLKLLGEPVANKIRKADLARIRTSVTTSAPASAPTEPKDEPTPRDGKQPKNIYEWREEIARRARE